jgi:hypothetical protein
MLPLLGSNDKEIQSRTRDIIDKLISKFTKAPSKEVAAAWNHIFDLAARSSNESLFTLLESFPYAKLEKGAQPVLTIY